VAIEALGREGFAPAGKLVRLMIISSAAP